MKQPKKVQRRVQEEVECTETQLLLTIDMKAINEELAAQQKDVVPNPQPEKEENKEVEKLDKQEEHDEEMP